VAFSKREESFGVLEYARSMSVVTVLAANQATTCPGFSLGGKKKNLESFSLSIGVKITTIRCVVYLLRIFKMFHVLKNNPVFMFISTVMFLTENRKTKVSGLDSRRHSPN
jgi:hypothetical protein